MRKSGTVRTTIVLAAAAALAGIVAASAGAAPARHSDTAISGAGSSFVAPLVSRWIPALGAAFGYNVSYSAVGSGAGITQITARTVDFGASDAPLSPDQFAACKGCIQIPWALSATAVFYNAASVPNLVKMDGPTLARIFMGQITTWNDAAIKKLNPGVNLPDQKITIAHRSDNSGTTFNFTDYLSAVSPSWKSQIGSGVAVNWPVGVGGKGSSGVAAIVSQTPGAIGYADVAYALGNHLKYFKMKNASGRFTVPALRNISAAAQLQTKPAADGSLSIVNPPKTKSKKFLDAYPICTYTYIIVPTTTPKAKQLKQMVSWAVTHGQQYGPKLVFQPLPLATVKFDEAQIAKIHS